PDTPPKASETSAVAVSYLTQAMQEAYTAGGGFPPRSLDSLADDETLILKPSFAKILELAFRAGECSSRATWEYRGIPEIARNGLPITEQWSGRKLTPFG